MRKSIATEDLPYFRKNTIAVKEELIQYNDILKLVVAVHGECKQYQEEAQLCNSDEWLYEVDKRVFNFKRKEHSWLKKTDKDDQNSKFSSKIKGYLR